MQSVCVYCGSNSGSDPAFALAADALGTVLVRRGLGLVYGGGSVGLMGIVADAVLAAGGEVLGVIPRRLVALEKEHRGLTQLTEVDSMHERKLLMMNHGDGFITLPGGFGTLEELFEVLAWLQLGFHNKPVGLLNVNGYYDGLLAFLDEMTAKELLLAAHRALLIVDTDPERLIDKMETFSAEGLTA